VPAVLHSQTALHGTGIIVQWSNTTHQTFAGDLVCHRTLRVCVLPVAGHDCSKGGTGGHCPSGHYCHPRSLRCLAELGVGGDCSNSVGCAGGLVCALDKCVQPGSLPAAAETDNVIACAFPLVLRNGHCTAAGSMACDPARANPAECSTGVEISPHLNSRLYQCGTGVCAVFVLHCQCTQSCLVDA
jgi:Dickkopf-like protein